jgi:hypothetical protein
MRSPGCRSRGSAPISPRCSSSDQPALLELGKEAVDLGAAEEEVHLGEGVGELALVPLHHAADGDDGAALARFLVASRFDNRVDRLLLRRVDEAAGVDEDDVGVGQVGGVRRAAVGQLGEVALGVDGVLVAAERDEADLHRASLAAAAGAETGAVVRVSNGIRET